MKLLTIAQENPTEQNPIFSNLWPRKRATLCFGWGDYYTREADYYSEWGLWDRASFQGKS
ncbi:MAG: hypothetical protein IPO62_00030 [Saprospiraceae bacterium]|nr:hypothetical protein [Saprospiraceae bacterium]